MRTGTLRTTSRLFGVLLVGVATSLDAGCIVLGDPEFEGFEECPPILMLQRASPPVNSIVRRSAGQMAEEFSVPMRSCAVTASFVAIPYVDGREMPSDIATVEDSGSEQRTVKIRPLSGFVGTGCHRVEVSVRRVEQPSGADDPLAVWWVVVGSEESSSVRVESCPGFKK